MLFDGLLTGHVEANNPATSVQGAKHVVKHGETPVVIADAVRKLFDSTDTSSVFGLRDRVLNSLL